MPSSPRHRPPSLTQAAVQELMNNPPTRKHNNSKFTGRDWRDITVGELVSPEDVCWVELDDSVEEATRVLLKSPTSVVLVRDSQSSNSVTLTFDFGDLNTYLLLVVGLTKPEDDQVALFNEIISKAQQNQKVPLRILQSLFCREATVQLDASSSLTQAVEILGSGIHRIVISDLANHVVGVMSQLRVTDFFWNEGVNFPTIERLYPALLRDLSIGTQNTISVNSDSPLSEALTTMNEEGLTSVAVIDNGHNVVGNISTKDVRHLTSTSSAPLLNSSCMHFISIILNERGVEQGQDTFPVFYVTSHVGSGICVTFSLYPSNATALRASFLDTHATISGAGSCGAGFCAGWRPPIWEANRDGSALCYSRPQSCPKLGDFTSLRSATAGFHPPHHILNRQLPSKGDTRLGDLSKVVNQLRALKSAPKKPRDEDLVTFNNASCKSIQIASISDSEADLFSSADNARTAPTRAAREQISSSNQVSLQRSRSTLDHRTSRVSLHRRKKSTSQLTRILTYELSDKAVVVPIFDVARTVEAAHRSLTQNLIPYCTADRHLTLKFPSNSSHGVYIFLDLSNIEISFQKALKKRYGVADAARFSPLPRLNLQFLTELLVRGRSSRGLHVGCSIFPGRKEPRYVQALRNLGYQVDVRERKRVDNGGLNVSQSKLPSALGTKPGSRYVEDLVDETLQTRIAEAVMEHFQKQGTIVLATGDAKPAQYSDGFFRYVERALRMGWNVELVAWHGSLSSSWKDNDWTATWGEKFRVIELDSFAYDLLEVQS
ncbi:Cystathionine beta-synthase, core [Cordyceps militaris CM01]|uniref:Cystathionine beta-synthase, core n=1 Tax=Cordyceps militaris (strain CM01) TaxID=983644 RepID=G3J3J7_CORMM|nr:Cystathionine beta-synthase, core [Cordyceps militaris CM01]EGX96525.1 Cystathionine beta-synthase, core [Cordyceps militaris CM01]